MMIRNTTAHPIDLSASAAARVALVCASNMPADGILSAPLPVDALATVVDTFYDSAGYRDAAGHIIAGNTLASGGEASTGQPEYGTFGGEPGTATCESAIVTTSDGTWRRQTLSVASRIANIATWSFRIVGSATSGSSAKTTSAW